MKMAQKIIEEFVKSVDDHVYPQYDLFVKKFEYVNGYKNVSFTDANVDFLQVTPSYCVHIKEVFKNGLSCLKQYQEHGIDSVPEIFQQNIKCLVEFLENKDRHLRCLVPFMDEAKQRGIPPNMRDSINTFLLAEHLFSPLIPGHTYYLDRNLFPEDLVTCPGECGATCTDHLEKPIGIGNSNVWHGFPDIWIGNQVPVTVAFEDLEVVDCAKGDFPTQRTMYENDDLASEVNELSENIQLPTSVPRTVALTIVNAFIQSKYGFVPTLCSSFGYLTIYMYDCVNDVFLMSPTDFPLKLFSASRKEFVDNHIIYLWMVLNYSICAKKPTERVIQYCKENDLLSGFPKQVKDQLKIYRNNLKQNVSSFPHVDGDKETEIAPRRLPYS